MDSYFRLRSIYRFVFLRGHNVGALALLPQQRGDLYVLYPA